MLINNLARTLVIHRFPWSGNEKGAATSVSRWLS
jgi:hypothetical protein